MEDIFGLGLDKLTLQELAEIANSFNGELELAEDKRSSKLLTIPSHIIKTEGLIKNRVILAIDLGGSSVRAGLYRADIKGANLEPFPNMPIFTKFYPELQTDFDSYLDFLQAIISELVTECPDCVDDIAIAFSFPATIEEHGDNLEISRVGMSDQWKKGFIVKDSAKNISACLRERLEAADITFEKWYGLNDVVALCLANKAASASLVVGTGYNIGILGMDNQVINTEAGTFSTKDLIEKLPKPVKIYMRDLAAKLSRDGFNPQESSDMIAISEMQIGGGFMYRLLINALLVMGEEHTGLINAIEKLASESLSLFINQDFQAFEQKTGVIVPAIKRKRLFDLSTKIFQRSTQLVAAELAGSLMYIARLHNLEELTVAVDGSVIREMPGFLKEVENTVKTLLQGVNCKLELVSDSGIKGAAYAALALRNNNH